MGQSSGRAGPVLQASAALACELRHWGTELQEGRPAGGRAGLWQAEQATLGNNWMAVGSTSKASSQENKHTEPLPRVSSEHPAREGVLEEETKAQRTR